MSIYGFDDGRLLPHKNRTSLRLPHTADGCAGSRAAPRHQGPERNCLPFINLSPRALRVRGGAFPASINPRCAVHQTTYIHTTHTHTHNAAPIAPPRCYIPLRDGPRRFRCRRLRNTAHSRHGRRARLQGLQEHRRHRLAGIQWAGVPGLLQVLAHQLRPRLVERRRGDVRVGDQDHRDHEHTDAVLPREGSLPPSRRLFPPRC